MSRLPVASSFGDSTGRAANVPVKTLPGLNELIAGDLDLARQMRPVQVEDLLGREPVEIDVDAIASYVPGKTVLVTGAGGSIGSELCRQLARAEPTRIVWSTRPRARSSRSSASSSTSAASARASPSSPTCATAAGCARSSSATARTSSSTRPRTSTCR